MTSMKVRLYAALLMPRFVEIILYRSIFPFFLSFMTHPNLYFSSANPNTFLSRLSLLVLIA